MLFLVKGTVPQTLRSFIVNLLSSMLRLSAISFLVVPILAQPGGEKKPVVEANITNASRLEALRKAAPADRAMALITVIEDQLSTRSFYAGQYSMLKGAPGVEELLREWVIRPPEIKTAAKTERPILRRACIRALRDLYGEKAPEGCIRSLQFLAVDEKLDKRVRDEAQYALAQFGFREFVGKRMVECYTMIATKDPAEQGKGLQGLANVLYQIRDYKKAVGAYKGYLDLYESGDVQIKNPQTIYYNTACCMSLSGMTDEAFEMLAKALKSGISLGQRMLLEDRDIIALRKDPRFKKLMIDIFGNAAPKPGAKKSGDGK